MLSADPTSVFCVCVVQVLTWLVLPFFQVYADAGDFTVGGRCMTSIRENGLLYGLAGAAGRDCDVLPLAPRASGGCCLPCLAEQALVSSDAGVWCLRQTVVACMLVPALPVTCAPSTDAVGMNNAVDCAGGRQPG
jgi:hypothetical protein